jgi:hypothetical protein
MFEYAWWVIPLHSHFIQIQPFFDCIAFLVSVSIMSDFCNNFTDYGQIPENNWAINVSWWTESNKRCRKYSESYLNYGFSVIDDDVKCYLLKVRSIRINLAFGSKAFKLVEFFQLKLKAFNYQQTSVLKLTWVNKSTLLSFSSSALENCKNV